MCIQIWPTNTKLGLKGLWTVNMFQFFSYLLHWATTFPNLLWNPSEADSNQPKVEVPRFNLVKFACMKVFYRIFVYSPLSNSPISFFPSHWKNCRFHWISFYLQTGKIGTSILENWLHFLLFPKYMHPYQMLLFKYIEFLLNGTFGKYTQQVTIHISDGIWRIVILW